MTKASPSYLFCLRLPVLSFVKSINVSNEILFPYFSVLISLLSVCLLRTLLSAILRGIPLALSIALFIIFSEYSLLSMSAFRFKNCLSLSSGLEQILTILKHSENGIFFVQDGGWQELGRRYMFLSVSFLYKSVSIFPSWMLHRTSRNGMEVCNVHWHLSSSASLGDDVWFIVNLIESCSWFISSNSLWRFFEVPWNIVKISSRNLLKIVRGLLLFQAYFCAKLVIILSILLAIKISAYDGAGLVPMAHPISCLYNTWWKINKLFLRIISINFIE